ncbi:hypothetical protein [Salinibacterium sp. ZJ454]|uniref:hypothetical protein n=1 Tax=Salinibacterium sp. ZJ454 TaxID=2708339 RepID=UPI0014232AFD|nr:hypothetical protein [Salinibacterium sp. ZJ454]
MADDKTVPNQDENRTPRTDPEFAGDEVVEPTAASTPAYEEHDPAVVAEPAPDEPMFAETQADVVDDRSATPALVEPPTAERSTFAPPVIPAAAETREADVDREPITDREPVSSAHDDEIAAPIVAPVAAAGATPATQVYPASAPQPEQPQIVYISEPNPPKKKSNRGLGALLAIGATVVFAVLFAIVSALLIMLIPPRQDFLENYLSFVTNPSFWLPVIVFAIAYILLVLISNNAGWWAHVLGGFIVAILVYLAFIGGGLLGAQAWTLTLENATRFTNALWLNPLAIAAFIVAREVPIWMGAAISARGRKVKARNIEQREEFDREQAAKRAEYERANARTA